MGDELIIEEYDYDKHKAEREERERALADARKKIDALCSDFYNKAECVRESVDGRKFVYTAGFCMLPIKDGDLVFHAGGRQSHRARELFDVKAACDILNEVQCDGFHQSQWGKTHLIERSTGSRRRIHMRNGRPALLDDEDVAADRKSVWDCSTFEIYETAKMRRIECIGGCMSVEVFEYPTKGFGGSESVMEIFREWMSPDRGDSRIRIMAPVHHFEQVCVLAGRVERIKMDLNKIVISAEAEHLVETGEYYG